MRRDAVKISRAEVKSLTVLSVVGVLSNRLLAKLVDRAGTKPLVLGWQRRLQPARRRIDVQLLGSKPSDAG